MLKKASRVSKKRSTVTKKSLSSPETYLVEIDVDRFCPKKIFDVVFLTAVDDETEKMTRKICQSAREYEDISALTFIHEEEILELINHFEQAEMPECLKTTIAEVCLDIRAHVDDQNPLGSLKKAELTKLKLINVMYKHYLKELDKMDKRLILEAELDCLTTVGGKRPHKEKDAPKQSKLNLSSKINSSNQDLRPVDAENEIIFDDDVYNHVWFYVFHGVSDPKVLLHLARHLRVNVRAIIKIDNHDKTPVGPYANFWNTVSNYLDGPYRESCFENTIQMTYSPCDGDDYVEMFKELSYCIKNISELKLMHLNYIRHMDIQRETEELSQTIPFSCFTNYNSYLDAIPAELTNHLVVLEGILEQIRGGHVTEVHEAKSIHSGTECFNPCSIAAIFKTPMLSQKGSLKEFKTFLAHEDDLINIIEKSYKRSEVDVCEIIPRLLRTIKTVHDLKRIEHVTNEMVYKLDIEPSSKNDYTTDDGLQHLLYLYLFSTFEHKRNGEEEIYAQEDNLNVYDRQGFKKSCQVRITGDKPARMNGINWYYSFLQDFIWKEDLPQSIMFQKLAKAKDEYIYIIQKYCDNTDRLMLLFSNCLDDFGVNIQIHEVSIPTPICLRDFCRYVTVERSAWLEQNKPRKYVRKLEEHEKCPGVRNIMKRDLFKEYRHLLDAQIKSETDMNVQNDEDDKLVTFEELLEELVAYPTSTNLSDECSKIEPKFLGYDLGCKYFAIRGATTTFVSHDNVKITVDNTKFVHEELKCSVVLDFDNHSLVFHSDKMFLGEDYIFHTNLLDGTVITFVLQDRKRNKRHLELASAPEIELKSSIIEEPEKDTQLTHNLNQVKNVISIQEEYFDGHITHTIPAQSIGPLLDHIKETILVGEDIYKVNKDLRYLKTYKSTVQIPFGNVLKRILHRSIRKDKSPVLFKKYCSRNVKTESQPKSDIDFRISRPNSLYISSYASTVRDNLVEIKQEFLDGNRRDESVKHEDFRLFTREGYVLIKKTDGCITLLKSSGDDIRYEYPDTRHRDIQQSNLKVCHCRTVNDYRRKLNRLFKSDNRNTYISRRAHLQTKKGYIINEAIMNIFRKNKPPYLKATSVKFDGQRISLKGNKITEKQMYYTTIQQDFAAQEIYFERTDGFQCLFDKFGTQTVRYVDGTRISSSIHISKKLVDGYVYVSLTFKYEHPLYATVIYNFNNSCEIQVNKDVTLRKDDTGNMEMNISSDIKIDIKKEQVRFSKNCQQCSLEYTCDVNVSPFSGNTFNYDEAFVMVRDTYNKTFQVDFAGNCQRNSDYIEGPLNRAKCNHLRGNEYEKLFIINTDFSGEYFWSDAKVQNMKKTNTGWANEEKLLKVRGKDVDILTFQKRMYESYAKRFINSELFFNTLNFSRNKHRQSSDVFYTIFRCIKRMLPATGITSSNLPTVWETLERSGIPNEMKGKLKILLGNGESTSNIISESGNGAEATQNASATDKCECTKRRVSMAEKMARWKQECQKYKNILRKNQIPPYFKSQFCRIRDRENKE